jgi:hypothetical protein
MIKHFKNFEKWYNYDESLRLMENLFGFTIFYYEVTYEIMGPETEFERRRMEKLPIQYEKDWVFRSIEHVSLRLDTLQDEFWKEWLSKGFINKVQNLPVLLDLTSLYQSRIELFNALKRECILLITDELTNNPK